MSTEFFRFISRKPLPGKTEFSGGRDFFPLNEIAQAIREREPRGVSALAVNNNYDENPSPDQKDLRYTGYLYLDIDGKGGDDTEKLEDATRKFLAFRKILKERWGINPDQYLWYVSGGKGYHIEVPMECFLSGAPLERMKDDGDALLPLIYKAMAETWNARMGEEVFDLSVYSMKQGNLWRTPNVQRDNGAYKVGLYPEEADKMTVALYRRVCSKPREPITPSPAEFSPELSNLFQSAKAKVEREQAEKEQASLSNGAAKHAIEDLPPTLRKLMDGEFTDQPAEAYADRGKPGFNKIATQLAVIGLYFGMSVEELVAQCAGIIQKHQSDSGKSADDRRDELRKVFCSVSSGGYSFSIPAIISILPKREYPDLKEFERRESVIQSFDYAGGKFELSRKGVFFVGTNKDGDEEHPLWICSYLRVLAKTRNEVSDKWGRLLEWNDDDGVSHRWAMPVELLQSDGTELRKELAEQGLSIGQGKRARDLLMAYLQVAPIDARVRCVSSLGWHGKVFVTPNKSIGQGDEVIVLQNTHANQHGMSVSGTVEDWRKGVATLAEGNSRMVFALSVAFAGTLLDITGEDSGGFHLRGGSSSGKSTVLKLAASVFGNPKDYVCTWRATDNGLEARAALHNDGVLILDELGECPARIVGNTIYMLGNGQGKERMARAGHSREPARWRLLFLSSGENSLVDILNQEGKRVNAGQEVRFAEIDSTAGADESMGVVENLHGQASSKELIDNLREAACTHYGAVGVQWLRDIVADRARLEGELPASIKEFLQGRVPPEAGGQVKRVANRFALVAVAGELATRYGLTGWPKGEAEQAAKTCFEVWLQGFGGTGNKEERNMLEQVDHFLAKHGASRFGDKNAHNNQLILNCAGFYEDERRSVGTDTFDTRDFFVLPEIFKREICEGYNPDQVAKVLRKAGRLKTSETGRLTVGGVYFPHIGKKRCYVITSMGGQDYE
jgi:uncharacterized protein (DUF927 family)